MDEAPATVDLRRREGRRPALDIEPAVNGDAVRVPRPAAVLPPALPSLEHGAPALDYDIQTSENRPTDLVAGMAPAVNPGGVRRQYGAAPDRYPGDMKTTALALVIALVATSGCSSSEAAGTGGGTGSSVENVRGGRYCEVLVGHLAGTNVSVDVYNTYGLGDCPDDAWKAMDPAQIKAAEMADVVILNGPRYWLMDAFADTKAVDPAPVTIGGLPMRWSGTLHLSLSQVMAGQKPYAPLSVARTTTWVYDAGQPVYELVDPGGRIFDMQSYSVATSPQTEASLAGLGQTLNLPSGWRFQTRSPDAALRVTAVDGLATIVQDELSNTYQLSQQ
jgi:hypothetical protein